MDRLHDHSPLSVLFASNDCRFCLELCCRFLWLSGGATERGRGSPLSGCVLTANCAGQRRPAANQIAKASHTTLPRLYSRSCSIRDPTNPSDPRTRPGRELTVLQGICTLAALTQSHLLDQSIHSGADRASRGQVLPSCPPPLSQMKPGRGREPGALTPPCVDNQNRHFIFCVG